VLTLTIPVAEQAKPRKIEVVRGEATAIGSHQGHKIISGETGTDEATTTHRQPAATTS
jgi:HSP20 family protein